MSSSFSGSPDVILYKLEQDLLRAEKRISYLESSNEKGRQREKALHDDVLASHRKASQLEQELICANKKLSKVQNLLSEVESKRLKFQQDYYEACRKISKLDAACASYAQKETRLQKDVISSHEKLTNFELQIFASFKKVTKLESNQDILEKKKNLLQVELLKNQEKVSELEASLATAKRRNESACNEKMKQQLRQTELEARVKHLQSDNDSLRMDLITSRRALLVLETQLVTLLKERARLNGKLIESARSVRKIEQENQGLREEVEDLSQNLHNCTEKILNSEKYEKLYEENQSLENTVSVYKTQLDRCLRDLEMEGKHSFRPDTVQVKTSKERRMVEHNGQRSILGDKCLVERDLPATVAIDPEETRILNEALVRDKQTLELRLQEALNCVNNYEEKSKFFEQEIERLKSSLSTAEAQKEKLIVSSQSQLEYIESDYKLKYESCRKSWRQEIDNKERLLREKEDAYCELLKFQSKYDSLWEELEIQQELNTALLSERENTEVKWQEIVTSYKRKYHECKRKLQLFNPDNGRDNEIKSGNVQSKQTQNFKADTELERSLVNSSNVRTEARISDMEEPTSPIENICSDIASKEPLQHELITNKDSVKHMSHAAENGASEIMEENFEDEDDDDNDVKSFIDGLRQDLQELRGKHRELKLENKKLKIEVATIGDKHEELQVGYNQLTGKRDREISELEHSVSAKEDEILELKKNIEILNSDRIRLEGELEGARLDVSSGQTEQLQRAIQEKESENEYLTRNIEQLNSEKIELQENLQKAFEKSLEVDKVAQLETSLEGKESEIRELKRQVAEADSKKADLQQNLQNALTGISELKNDLDTARENNNELQQKVILLQSQAGKTVEKVQAPMEVDAAEKRFLPSVYSDPNTDGLSDSQRLKKELEGGVKFYIEKMQKRVADLEENNEKLKTELRQHKAEIDSSDFALTVNAELKAKIESQDDFIAELRANNERLKTEVKDKQSEIELANNAKERKTKMIEVLEAKVTELEAKLKAFELQPKEREELLEKENKKLKAEVEELQNRVAELESQTRGLSRVRDESTGTRAELANMRKKLADMDKELRKAKTKQVTYEQLYGPSVSQQTPPKQSETDGPPTDAHADSSTVVKRNKTKVGQIPTHYRHSYAGGTYPRPFVPAPESKQKAVISEQTANSDSISHPQSDNERRNSIHSDASRESEASASSESGFSGALRRPIQPYRAGAKPFGVTTARPFFKSVDERSPGETTGNRRPQSWAEYSQQTIAERHVSSSETSSVQSETEAEKLLAEEEQLVETPVQCVEASPNQLPENCLEFGTKTETEQQVSPELKEEEIQFSCQEDIPNKSPTRVCVVKDFEEESRLSSDGQIKNIIDESSSASNKPSESPISTDKQPESSQKKKNSKAQPIFIRTFKSPPPRQPPAKPEKFNYKTYMKSTLQTTKTTREDDSYVTQQPTRVIPEEKDHFEHQNRPVKTFVLEATGEENGINEQAKPVPSVDDVDGSTEVTKRESVNSLVNQWNRRVSVNLDDI